MLSGAFLESEVKDFSETVDDGEFAEEYGYSSDSDLEEDWDFESPAPPPGHPQPPQPEALYGEYKEHIRKGRVLKIQDVAFITYVFPKPNLFLSQLGAVSKLSCYICTQIQSHSHHSDPKKIGSREVPKLPGPKKERYPDRHRNRCTDWQTRLQTILPSQVLISDHTV